MKRKQSILVKSFLTLMNNDSFKKRFDDRFNSLLDTLLSSAQMQDRIDRIIDERKDEITKPSKWQVNQVAFDTYVSNLKEFATQRAEIVRAQLDAFDPTF